MPTGMGPIKKNKGETPAERYLSSLCKKTFLSLWYYPCVYNDRNTANGQEGQEICDVLMFLNDVMLCYSITPEELDKIYLE